MPSGINPNRESAASASNLARPSWGGVNWRRWAMVGSVAVICAYVAMVVAGPGAQHPPDFAAFYSVARALRLGGLEAARRMYSLHFQLRAGAFLSKGPGLSYAEPFVNPPPAAWVVIPFTLLPLQLSFFIWDALLFSLCLFGAWWLARLFLSPRDANLVALAAVASYPTYMALGEGQYDLLWPLCLALFASALRLREVRRWLPRGAGAALIFTFKPDLLLAMVVPAMRGGRRTILWSTAGVVALLAAVSLCTIGLAGLQDALRLESLTLLSRFPPTHDTTVLGFLWHATGPGRLSEVLATAAIPIGIGLLAWAWWRRPPVSSADWMFALSSATCLSLVIAPHALNHSLLLLVGPMVWVARAFRELGRTLWWLAPWVVAFNLAMVIDTSPRIDLPIPLTPLVLLLATVCAWRAKHDSGPPTLRTGHSELPHARPRLSV